MRAEDTMIAGPEVVATLTRLRDEGLTTELIARACDVSPRAVELWFDGYWLPEPYWVRVLELVELVETQGKQGLYRRLGEEATLPEVLALLVELRDSSGLTLRQIARAAGTYESAVRYWLDGYWLASRYRARLFALADLVHSMDATTTGGRRLQLLASSPWGKSPYQELCESVPEDEQVQRVLPGEMRLGPREDDDDEPKDGSWG